MKSAGKISSARAAPAAVEPASTCLRSLMPIALVLACYGTAWMVIWISVPPDRQDFPLDDDWAFARGAFQFALGRGCDYAHWSSMPLLGQWLWAMPFARLWPGHHAALRLSTMILSGFGLIAFYDLLLQSQFKNVWGSAPDANPVAPARGTGVAAFLTALLAFNPLFFLLSGTFLSDVPSLSFSLIALAAYWRALIRDDRRWLAIGAIVALVAVSTRQNSVACVLAATMMWWRRPELRFRAAWIMALLIPLFTLIAIQTWFVKRSDTGPVLPGLFPPEVGFLLPYWIFHYLGLSVLGAAVALRVPNWSRADVWMMLVMIAGACYWFVYGRALPYGGLFPYRQNLLTPWGALAGAGNEPLYPGDRPIVMSDGFRLLVTALGCAGGGVLAARLWRMIRPLEFRPGLFFWFTVWQVPFLLLAPKIHDRYLLVFVPGALAVAAYNAVPIQWRLAIGTGICIIVALASVGLMHDWLAWNSAWWALGNRAVDRRVSATDIEGGFEWDAWHSGLAPRKPPAAGGTVAGGLALPNLQRWFSEVTGRYALSFSEVDDTVTLDSQPFTLWLRPGQWRVYLVRPVQSGEARP